MTCPTRLWIPAVLLSLGLHLPAQSVQAAPPVADSLHAQALDSFRQARFSEAYGRLMRLADAGHAPSAELALWMFAHGPSLFGKDWDCSPDQLAAWAQLTGQATPVMVGRLYPPAQGKLALQARRAAP